MYLERLSTISSRIDGALALSLVDRDGIPVESVSLAADLDLETIAAEMVAQLRSIEQQQPELSLGSVRHFAVSSERASILLSVVAQGYFLMLLLEPESPLGRARFELRRAALLFEDDLI